MTCKKSDWLIVAKKRMKVRGAKGPAVTHFCKEKHNYCTRGTERLWKLNEQE